MGKGSSPRPFSVSISTYNENFDRIFGKKDKMTPRVEQMKEGGTSCGCGRSPTGKCLGWHGLDQISYEKALKEYQEKQSQTQVDHK